MATLESIQARIKKLQSQAEVMVAKRAQGALDQIRELMIKHGLTTEDIESRAKARRERERAERLGLSAPKAKGATAAKGKMPAKYRDPKTGATWSGHARPPAWIKNVKDRTKFLIDATAAAAAEPVAAAKKVTAKKAAAKKAVAKKATAVKSAVRKVAKKAAAKKTAVKAAAKKTVAKKAAAKPVSPTAATKKVAAKKAVGKKAPAKKAAAKKAPVKSAAPVVETPAAVQAAPVQSTGEA
jgi:DNA-binding protein H-NS